MPLYEYECPNGHKFTLYRRMGDAPWGLHCECGEKAERVFSKVNVAVKDGTPKFHK